MLFEIILIIFGSIVGVLVDRIYSKIFNEEESFEKRLKKLFLEATKDNAKRKITVKEIISLLRQKVLDKDGEYKVCPSCGNKKIEQKFFTYDGDMYDEIEYKKCGWSGENPLFKIKKDIGIPL